MASRVVISHSRRTKREGAGVLASSLLTVVGLIVFCHIFFPNMREEGPIFYFVYNGGALLIGGLLVFAYAIPNLLMDREFRLTLFEDRIECKSPAKAYGESYSIPLSEIVMLEEEMGNEGPSDWWLITHDDRRILITPNYGNPVAKIVEALQHLKPEITLKRV